MKPAEHIIREWQAEPKRFVRQVFNETPDAWQDDGLDAVRDNKRTAFSACKGPGKSRLESWIAWWRLFCWVDSQIMAMSITADNLRDNLWKELSGRYQKSPILQTSFDFNTQRIMNRERPNTWWCSARAYARDADPERQADSLSGFHAKVLMVLLDEVGGIPLGVLAAADAIHLTTDTDAKTVVAGNPTDRNLALGQIVLRERKKWHIIFITGDPDDPKRSPRIDIEEARKMIDELGRDHPWVRVNLLGLFPLKGTDSLIGDDEVDAAMQRGVSPAAIMADAHVAGLDPARFGDDEQAFTRRKGLCAWKSQVWRNLDGVQLADQIDLHILRKFEEKGDPLDALFVDVGGVGASCFDHLKFLGWSHIISGVDFGARAQEPHKYFNRRSEMWGRGANWLATRPCSLENDRVLAAELVAPKYSYRVVGGHTVMLLESKEDMKARGIPSPNRADSWALTFAGSGPLKARELQREQGPGGRRARAVTEYDIYRNR